MTDTATRKAKVKATGEEIEVYKLKQPADNKRWCILLGDKLTVASLDANKHQQTFTDDELQFLD